MPARRTSNIQYVCLSDLHLGEEDSLLTDIRPEDGAANPTVASPVLKALVACVKSVISRNARQTPKPTLVLNGDVLELALAGTHEAAMAFERLAELTMSKDGALFDRIVCIPGNHDHHLWETGRETQYVNAIIDNAPDDQPLPPAYHTTGMFLDAKKIHLPRSYLMTRLARRATGRDACEIELAYPNHAIVKKVQGQNRCIIFHHGHFVESLYQLTSELRSTVFPRCQKPETIYDLEGENFAWIDFFWSALGRSAGVGHDVEQIYEKMKDPDEFKRLTRTVAHELAKRFDIPNLPGDWLEEKALRYVPGKLVEQWTRGGRERGSQDLPYPGLPLSGGAQEGLADYVERFVYRQIRKERRTLVDEEEKVAGNVTFVFGHTHKPFARALRFSKQYQGRVAVYNTGGWVVESPAPRRDSPYGGSVLFVDDKHEVVSLRMYGEGSEGPAFVEEAIPPEDPTSSLAEHIKDIMRSDRLPWDTFQRAVRRAIFVRAENLRRRIHSP